jgi:hypothetical protein
MCPSRGSSPTILPDFVQCGRFAGKAVCYYTGTQGGKFPHPSAHGEIRFTNRQKACAGLASNSDENFLALAGKSNQFAESCFGFPQCGNHVTNVVLSAADVKSERGGSGFNEREAGEIVTVVGTFPFPSYSSRMRSRTLAASPERSAAMASLTWASGNVWVTSPSRRIFPLRTRLMRRGISMSGETLPPWEPLRIFLKCSGRGVD